MSNFGDDLILNEDGDLELTLLGDLYTTDDEELDYEDLPFSGYVCFRNSIVEELEVEQGEYNPFPGEDGIDFGLGLNRLVSTNLSETFSIFSNRAKEAYSNDERIKDVLRLDYEKSDINTYQIYLDLLVVGVNKPISVVYPFIAT